MRKPPVDVRPATAEDIAEFSAVFSKLTGRDVGPLPTVRAWAGEVEGRIIALGGIAFAAGRWIGFVDVTEEARSYKLQLMLAAKRFLDAQRRQGVRFIYAMTSANEPDAARWLESLGFRPDHRSAVLYRWSGKN